MLESLWATACASMHPLRTVSTDNRRANLIFLHTQSPLVRSHALKNHSQKHTQVLRQESKRLTFTVQYYVEAQ